MLGAMQRVQRALKSYLKGQQKALELILAMVMLQYVSMAGLSGEH